MPPRIFDLYRARYDGQYSFDFLQDRIAEFDREHGCRTREVRISYEPGENPRLSFETLGDAQALGEFLEPVMPVGIGLEVTGIEAYEPDDLVYGGNNEIVGVHGGHRRGGTRYVRRDTVSGMGFVTDETARRVLGDLVPTEAEYADYALTQENLERAKAAMRRFKTKPAEPPESRLPTRADLVFFMDD